jgi:16S rRNA (cytosine1402-N4)-methyltransferase
VTHVPVLAQEALGGLHVVADGVYVDATFGRGGHSRQILERLGPRGRLIAIDRDPDAVKVGTAWKDARFTMVQGRFGRMEDILAQQGVKVVDGVLLDAGVSSPQLDDSARGFSFMRDAPLDMRMDHDSGESAAHWISVAGDHEIEQVIRRYGEDRFAKRIARAIVAQREQAPITRTRRLADIVAAAVPAREPGQHPATRTFQAIRIFINRELEELAEALPQSVTLLRAGGRLVVISFHSLEDRLVKRFMRTESCPDFLPLDLPVRAADLPKPRLMLVGKAVRPSASEVDANPRARSAVMRVAEKCAV